MGILRNYANEVAREHVAWARKNRIRRATMLRALGHADEDASWDELVEVVAAAWYEAILRRHGNERRQVHHRRSRDVKDERRAAL